MQTRLLLEDAAVVVAGRGRSGVGVESLGRGHSRFHHPLQGSDLGGFFFVALQDPKDPFFKRALSVLDVDRHHSGKIDGVKRSLAQMLVSSLAFHGIRNRSLCGRHHGFLSCKPCCNDGSPPICFGVSFWRVVW